MIKKLAGCVRQYKLYALLTPVLVILETVAEIIIPLVMAELIDKGIYAGDMQVVVVAGIKLLGLTCLALAFGVAAGFTASYGSAGFAAKCAELLVFQYRQVFYSKYSNAPYN